MEWLRAAHDGPIVIGELRALDPNSAPIAQIELQAAGDGWPAVLRITIPDGQMAGNYSGMAVDAVTNVPCATILLEIPCRASGSAEPAHG
jgi:hypothetical protein